MKLRLSAPLLLHREKRRRKRRRKSGFVGADAEPTYHKFIAGLLSEPWMRLWPVPNVVMNTSFFA